MGEPTFDAVAVTQPATDLTVHHLDVELGGNTQLDLTTAPKLRVGTVPFTVTTFAQAVEWLLKPASGKGKSVRLANAFCVAEAQRDPQYSQLLATPDGINLPDGKPVHWAMLAQSWGLTKPERVRGPSLFRATLSASESQSVAHFFLGGSPHTLNRLLHIVRRDLPNTTIAGAYSPPFGDLNDVALADWAKTIVNSQANLVWVGLGSPKQDYATEQLARLTGLHCVGVGAAFDYLAGTQREAPKWIQLSALEWLFRLMVEPRRLWRRYVFGNVRFILAIISGYSERKANHSEPT